MRPALSHIDAASLLGVTEGRFAASAFALRTLARPACWTGGWGQASGKRVPTEPEAQIERSVESASRRSTFTSILVRDHGFTWGYTWTKVFLQSKGPRRAARTAPSGRAGRCRAGGKHAKGVLDGSRHEWLGLDAMDLIVTMDDVTSAIHSAFLLPEEGTAPTFQALMEVFGRDDLPLSPYTDRGSHYFHTPIAGGRSIASP